MTSEKVPNFNATINGILQKSTIHFLASTTICGVAGIILHRRIKPLPTGFMAMGAGFSMGYNWNNYVKIFHFNTNKVKGIFKKSKVVETKVNEVVQEIDKKSEGK